MPIKQATDYDMQFAINLTGYQTAVKSNNWIVAQHWVQNCNSCLTPENRITDLPKFEITVHSFTDKSMLNERAMIYCFKYMPIVEMAIANERATLYVTYKAGM